MIGKEHVRPAGSRLGGASACVFLAARGDRNRAPKSTIVLSTVVTAFGVGLFSYFLQVPLPILTWGGTL